VGATYALPAAIATLHDTARPRGGLPLAVGVLPAAIIPMPAQRRARVVILLVGAIVCAPLLGGGVIAHLPTPHSGASSDLRRGRGTRREGLVWQHRARAFSTASRRRVVIHGLRHLGPSDCWWPGARTPSSSPLPLVPVLYLDQAPPEGWFGCADRS
jgi:hypothetical protein